jgi:hypothetical protein
MFSLLFADAAASTTPDVVHTLLGMLEQGAIGLLALAATAAAARLSSYLSSHASANVAFGAASRAYELAKSIVAHVDAKVRPQLVKALDDGALSPEERVALQNAAMAALKEALGGPDGLADLKKALGLEGDSALDTYLSGLLERALAAFRGAQAAGDPQSPASLPPAAVAAAVRALTATSPATSATPAPRP